MSIALRKQKRHVVRLMLSRPPFWCRRYRLHYVKPVPVKVNFTIDISPVQLGLPPDLVELMSTHRNALRELTYSQERIGP